MQAYVHKLLIMKYIKATVHYIYSSLLSSDFKISSTGPSRTKGLDSVRTVVSSLCTWHGFDSSVCYKMPYLAAKLLNCLTELSGLWGYTWNAQNKHLVQPQAPKSSGIASRLLRP